MILQTDDEWTEDIRDDEETEGGVRNTVEVNRCQEKELCNSKTERLIRIEDS